MFSIGWSTDIITPEKPVWLCGYAARNKFSNGVHDPLFVKVCYLSDGTAETILISCDMVSVYDRQLENVKKKIQNNSGVKNIIFSATHTHSGPVTSPELTMDENHFDKSWSIMVEDKVSDAALKAKISAIPSTLYAGFSTVPEVTKNRRTGETEVDDELAILYAKDNYGKITGIIVNYACHCTVLDSSNYLISADYPQFIYQGAEKLYPGVTAMFFNGACGNLNIGYSADDSALGVNMGELRSFTNAEKVSGFILEGLKRAMISSSELTSRIQFSYLHLDFSFRKNLPSLQSLGTEQEQLQKINPKDTAIKTRLMYVEALHKKLKAYCKNGEKSIKSESVIIDIGDVVIVTIPGELFCEIGKAIKSIFRPEKQPLIFGYSNGYVGYLPTKKAFLAGGYECETSVHGPETESYLVETIKKAARRNNSK